MNSYAAFLGHQPHISTAELQATFPDFLLTRMAGSTVPSSSKNVLLFESAADIDRAQLNLLGGTVAIARRVTDVVVSLEDVPQLLADELADIKGKVIFGLRTFGLPQAKVRELYRSCKEELRRRGRGARYVGSDRVPAAAVLLKDAGLLDGRHGCEIAVIQEEETLWIGRTVAAQDTNAYIRRDMKKPVRDTRTGLLPPKLAQILLNFGQWLAAPGNATVPLKKRKPLVVLDPFCGTGVIPIECLLRGWEVLASDKSQRAVSGCEKNIEWIRKEEKIPKKDVASRVWKQDATKPFDLKQKPDIIVTETTLGTAFEKRPPIRESQKERNENERLQEAFLRNMAASFPGVPVVCTWPVWYHSKGNIALERIWQELPKLGFEAVLPPGTQPSHSGRRSLQYRRPEQFIAREIVLLRPRELKIES